jgi:hypothetical protein
MPWAYPSVTVLVRLVMALDVARRRVLECEVNDQIVAFKCKLEGFAKIDE